MSNRILSHLTTLNYIRLFLVYALDQLALYASTYVLYTVVFKFFFAKVLGCTFSSSLYFLIYLLADFFCIISLLELVAVPHNYIPYVHIVFQMDLLTRSLFCIVYSARFPINQQSFLNLCPTCFLFVNICSLQVNVIYSQIFYLFFLRNRLVVHLYRWTVSFSCYKCYMNRLIFSFSHFLSFVRMGRTEYCCLFGFLQPYITSNMWLKSHLIVASVH